MWDLFFYTRIIRVSNITKTSPETGLGLQMGDRHQIYIIVYLDKLFQIGLMSSFMKLFHMLILTFGPYEHSMRPIFFADSFFGLYERFMRAKHLSQIHQVFEFVCGEFGDPVFALDDLVV